MRVVLYSRTEVPHFSALAEGCRATGHTVVWQRPSHFKTNELVKNADAVVIPGIQFVNAKILSAYKPLGVQVWITDLPRLRLESAMGFYLDTVHWVPKEGYRKPVVHGLIKDRKPEVALVCGQVPNDIAHGMPANAWDEWAKSTVRQTREVTGLPVVYRQHPVYKAPLPPDGFGADAISDSDSETLYQAMKNVAVLVCHNSTCGWEAIDAGVPVFATATGENRPGYDEYALKSLEHITALPKAKRTEALARVASTQWTLDELRNGEAAGKMFGLQYVEELKIA